MHFPPTLSQGWIGGRVHSLGHICIQISLLLRGSSHSWLPGSQRGLPETGRGRLSGARCPARRARERSRGKGCCTNTCSPIHTRSPFLATSGGTWACHPASKPTWPGEHRLARARTCMRARYKAPSPSIPLVRAQTRGHARPLPAGRPPGTSCALRARAAPSPSSSRPRPWGRGALGAGPATPPGKLREVGRPPPHPPAAPRPSQ